MHSDLVSLSRHRDVGVITIDNPPVNALSPGVPEGIAQTLGEAERDDSIRAIVIVGAGRTFIAGADIRELERAAAGAGTAPLLHDLLRQIEDCRKPVVMALHGTALGGGLELAMAGHYRAASPDARAGQPEVNLGIIPGAEGTQRLPRLVGIEKAIEMCVSGKPVGAADALAAGLIDRVIDGDLRAGAVAFACEVASASSHRKTRDRSDKLGTRDAIDPLLTAGRDLARKTRRNMLAPLKVVDAIGAAATLPFADGVRRERELFAECLESDQCKALVHAFFAERAVSRVPDVPK